MKIEKIAKAFEKLSDEDKNKFLSQLGISDETDDVETNTNSEQKETSTEETDQGTTTDKVAENQEQKETQEQTLDEKQPDPNQGIVEGNAADDTMISVDDLVTKDVLNERLSAMEAKLSSLIDENKKLKDEKEQLANEKEQLTNKYEKDDFGNQTANPTMGNTKSSTSTYESYDEYVKKFTN